MEVFCRGNRERLLQKSMRAIHYYACCQLWWGEATFSMACMASSGLGSTTLPQCIGNAQIPVLVVFNPHSHLDSLCGLQEKAVPSFPTPCEVESDIKQMDFEVHMRSWQGPDFCIREMSYRSALVHSKPQASGCGCLHSLLHPS